MEIIKYPGREEWSSLIKRPALDVTTLFDTVRTVLDEVREQGDTAVKAYEEKFDKVLLSSLQVSEEEMREADALVAEDLKQAIRTAKSNIEKFHASQRFEGKKYAEIASALSLSVKTVEAEMTKALQTLRKEIENYTQTV